MQKQEGQVEGSNILATYVGHIVTISAKLFLNLTIVCRGNV